MNPLKEVNYFYRQRKSVIVKHCSRHSQGAFNHVQDDQENGTICDIIKSSGSVKLDIDIPAINAMFNNYLVQEEKSYLQIIKLTFDKSWKEMNHGERIMNDYIKCCQTKREFSSDFFHLANRQYR